VDQQLIQRTRYLLQTRFRRVFLSEPGNFVIALQQALTWVEYHPIIGSIIHQLGLVSGEHNDELDRLCNREVSFYNYNNFINAGGHLSREDGWTGYTPKNTTEHASACLKAVRCIIAAQDISIYQLLATYFTKQDYIRSRNKYTDLYKDLSNFVVKDLYEYIDETLDGINSVNGILLKYKQNAEWFQQDKVKDIIENGYAGRRGERALAIHLQQYIFDQGLEFVIEPSSVSGETDLILREFSGRYLIIDAKLIKPGEKEAGIIRKIAEGSNQVARYCNDYNERDGFLVVFVNDNLSIMLDFEQQESYRFIQIGGCIIHLVTVNIASLPSASKAGKARQIHISREQLTQKFDELASN
jgi:hypothetical protein